MDWEGKVLLRPGYIYSESFVSETCAGDKVLRTDRGRSLARDDDGLQNPRTSPDRVCRPQGRE